MSLHAWIKKLNNHPTGLVFGNTDRMTHSILDALPWWQLLLIGACFVWSGFVRSGLGFGGAALSLPLLLMFVNEPLLFLPAICFQLLFFSLLTVVTRMSNVDWGFLVKILCALAIPFAVGLVGLLKLPGALLSSIVYISTLIYGIGYVLNYVFSSRSKIADFVFLSFGGYVSGVSLIGAPLIVAVGARYLHRDKMRDTFFVLWIVLVILKIGTFVAADVNLQWRLALLSFPLAGLGHYLGLQVHQRIMQGNKARFERFVGTGLIVVSLLGLINLFNKWVA